MAVIQSGQLFVQQGTKKTQVAKQLSAARDVHISYDAKSLLLTARQNTSAPWQIFEVTLASGELRQVSHCLGDCVHPAYLPDGRVAFTVFVKGGSFIASAKPDGTDLQRITFGPGDFDVQGVLPDGRLLLVHSHMLFGIRPDGTGLESIHCGHGRSAALTTTDSVRVELAAWERPRLFWSTLKPQLGVGHFIALDSRITSPDTGGALKASPRSVRVWSLDAAGVPCDLGIAPVEADGSFFVAVAADKPVRFELLDEKGNSIRSEASWIWVRSGEERGCVGCHAEKAVSPPNRWPLTLKRFDTPTKLMGDADAK